MMKVRIVKKQHVAKEEKIYTWWQHLVGKSVWLFGLVSLLSAGWMSRTDVQWDIAMAKSDLLIKFDMWLINLQSYLGILQI